MMRNSLGDPKTRYARYLPVSGVLAFVVKVGPGVGRFLLFTPAGTLALVVVGFVLIGLSNRLYGGSATRPAPRGRQGEDAALAAQFRALVAGDGAKNVILFLDEIRAGRGLGWQGLRERGDPYLTITLSLVNASLHRLLVGSFRCEGHIRYEEMDLRGPPTPSVQGLDAHHVVVPGAKVVVTVRQELLPNVVDDMRGKAGQRVRFSFTSLRLITDADLGPQPGAEPVTWAIPFAERGWNGEAKPEVPSAAWLRG